MKRPQEDAITRLLVAAKGGGSAVDRLLRAVLPRVRRVASANVVPGDDDMTDDASNAALVKIWQSIGRYDPRLCSGRHWVGMIARRTASDMRRDSQRREAHEVRGLGHRRDESWQPADERGVPPEAVAESKSRAEILQRALAGLGARDREVLRRRYVEGENTTQIAREMKVSVAAVLRARRRLARRPELAGVA